MYVSENGAFILAVNLSFVSETRLGYRKAAEVLARHGASLAEERYYRQLAAPAAEAVLPFTKPPAKQNRLGCLAKSVP